MNFFVPYFFLLTPLVSVDPCSASQRCDNIIPGAREQLGQQMFNVYVCMSETEKDLSVHPSIKGTLPDFQ